MISLPALTLSNIITASIALGMFLLGFGGLRGLVMLFGKSYPRFLANPTLKIFLTLAAVSYGRFIDYQTGPKQHNFRAADETTIDGESAHAITVDGQTKVIKGGLERMTRLGLRPFGIAAAKTEEMMDAFGADDLQQRKEAATDGGNIVERNGTLEWDASLQHDDGWVVPLRRKALELKDAGGSRVIDKSEREALVKEGGKQALSPLLTVVASFFAFLCGGGMALLTLVVMG